MQRYDVGIVGGGLVGASLGCALASGGLSVAMLDREEPQSQEEQGYDGRASAIAHGSAQVLKGIGLWPYLADAASPIWDIRVVDGSVLEGVSPLFLHYDHADLGDDPFGFIIENRKTREALHRRCAELNNLTALAPVAATGVEAGPGFSRISLADGAAIEASVVIAADGKFSTLRGWAGIKVAGWSYDQTSIVCTVRHAEPHGGVAVELFLPGGPFNRQGIADACFHRSGRSDLCTGWIGWTDLDTGSIGRTDHLCLER